jgi:DNA primase catalytic core
MRSPESAVSRSVSSARLIAMHSEALRFYRGLLLDPYAGWPRSHLRSRRLGHALEPASRWKLGYAPRGWDVLIEHLRRRGFAIDELDASGLVTRDHRNRQIDRFRDRLVFPIRNAEGQPVSFIARARPGADHQIPKYLNGPTTPIYDKSAVLFGLTEQRDRFTAGAIPIIVEGPTDVLAVDASIDLAGGQRAAVAACGTSLTRVQVDLLRRVTRRSTVVFAADADRAGRLSAIRANHLLVETFRTVLATELPAGGDPADVLVDGGPGAVRSALDHASPLAGLLVRTEIEQWRPVLDHLGGKVDAVHAVAHLLAQLPSEQVAAYVSWLGRRLDLDPAVVTHALVDDLSPRPLGRAQARRLFLVHQSTPSVTAHRGIDR